MDNALVNYFFFDPAAPLIIGPTTGMNEVITGSSLSKKDGFCIHVTHSLKLCSACSCRLSAVWHLQELRNVACPGGRASGGIQFDTQKEHK